MSCHELHLGESRVTICRANGETVPVLGKRRKRFWCFQCRKHLLHTRMAFIPDPMSYYEPNFWWACERCHEEHVLFPGREWVEVE